MISLSVQLIELTLKKVAEKKILWELNFFLSDKQEEKAKLKLVIWED